MNPGSSIRRAGLCLGVAFVALAITLGAKQTSRSYQDLVKLFDEFVVVRAARKW